MATITFFEKPGCINNTKQKKLLTLSGHTVESVDLIKYPWTAEELLSFFQDLDVSKWFNLNAPSVQNGEVVPASFDIESALSALLANHLLIKRPLMVIGEHRLVGFNATLLDELVGLDKLHPDIAVLLGQNLTDCPQKQTGNSCS